MLERLKQQFRQQLLDWLRPGESTEELMHILKRAGAVRSDEQRRMFEDVIEFRETRVREIMVPRSEITAIDISADLQQAETMMLEQKITKLLVMDGDLDHILGTVYIWDLLGAHVGEVADSLQALVQPCLRVSELERVPGLLTEMKAGSHIAIVLDEFGGTAGLVTLSDLLEEIVGDIGQGQSSDEKEYQRTDSGWEVQAKIHVEDLADLLDIELPEGDFDTVGGLITTELGRIPVKGERLMIAGLDMHIKEADPRKVIRVLIKLKSKPDKSTSDISDRP